MKCGGQTLRIFWERGEKNAQKGKLEIILNLGVLQTTAKTVKESQKFFKFKTKKKNEEKNILIS